MDPIPWKTAEVSYEGAPLLLRCPVELALPFQDPLPILVVLTHELEQVTSSGLPEPDYNESLFGFDQAATELFPSGGGGVAVLVETFSGRRTYYYYVAADIDVEATVDTLRQQFVGLRLSVRTQDDQDSRFIRRYSEDFGLWV